jgi:hypothetical protein
MDVYQKVLKPFQKGNPEISAMRTLIHNPMRILIHNPGFTSTHRHHANYHGPSHPQAMLCLREKFREKNSRTIENIFANIWFMK